MLTAVYEPLAVISRPHGCSLVPVDQLGEAELGKVADFLEHRAPRAKWKDSKSALAVNLLGRLEVLRDKDLVPFEPGDRLEPEFYLVYFGAGWCGPCRRFSPGFVESYGQLKRAVGDRFEVIFASWDESVGGQIDYVKEAHMPWPVIKFRMAREIRAISRWEGNGIPCLVVLTPNGELLYHTYRGEEYMGPQSALDAFVSLLNATRQTPAARKAMFKLAALQRQRGASGKSLPPKPYFVQLDPAQYQTLDATSLRATLHINERGEVAEATFEPQQSAVIDYSLVTDAQQWRFLPALKNGAPVATTVVLPIDMPRRADAPADHPEPATSANP
jgi:thiol-disulfide isomerase/thioredoxin